MKIYDKDEKLIEFFNYPKLPKAWLIVDLVIFEEIFNEFSPYKLTKVISLEQVANSCTDYFEDIWKYLKKTVANNDFKVLEGSIVFKRGVDKKFDDNVSNINRQYLNIDLGTVSLIDCNIDCTDNDLTEITFKDLTIA
ncbi:MAG: hypothetical protein J6D03_06775 [Clostridia bacterium]|nr:hypothetical protein [Clostridia bacterium]